MRRDASAPVTPALPSAARRNSVRTAWERRHRRRARQRLDELGRRRCGRCRRPATTGQASSTPGVAGTSRSSPGSSTSGSSQRAQSCARHEQRRAVVDVAELVGGVGRDDRAGPQPLAVVAGAHTSYSPAIGSGAAVAGGEEPRLLGACRRAATRSSRRPGTQAAAARVRRAERRLARSASRDRALMSRAAPLASFAHDGTRPQRRTRSGRVPPRCEDGVDRVGRRDVPRRGQHLLGRLLDLEGVDEVAGVPAGGVAAAHAPILAPPRRCLAGSMRARPPCPRSRSTSPPPHRPDPPRPTPGPPRAPPVRWSAVVPLPGHEERDQPRARARRARRRPLGRAPAAALAATPS